MKQVSDRKCGVATKLGYVTLSWTGVTQQKREWKKSKKKKGSWGCAESSGNNWQFSMRERHDGVRRERDELKEADEGDKQTWERGSWKMRQKKKKRGVKCNMKQSLCWVLVLASCGCGERRQASVQRTESRLWKTNMLTQTHDVPQKLRAVSCSHNTNIQKQEVKIQVDSLRHVRFLFLLPRKKKYVCAAVSVCIQLRLFRRVFLLNNVFFMTLQLIIMLIKANQTTMVSWQRMYFGPTGYCLVTFFLFFLNSVYFFE